MTSYYSSSTNMLSSSPDSLPLSISTYCFPRRDPSSPAFGAVLLLGGDAGFMLLEILRGAPRKSVIAICFDFFAAGLTTSSSLVSSAIAGLDAVSQVLR